MGIEVLPPLPISQGAVRFKAYSMKPCIWEELVSWTGTQGGKEGVGKCWAKPARGGKEKGSF